MYGDTRIKRKARCEDQREVAWLVKKHVLLLWIVLVVTGCGETTSINVAEKEDKRVFEVKENIGEESSTVGGVEEEFGDETSDEQKNLILNNVNKNDTDTSLTNTNVHTHNFVEHTQIVTHLEEGHYETQVVQAAYDEDVYAWRTFCNVCKQDITELSADDLTYHVAILCRGSYANYYVVVDTVHHEAVTKQVWVVDTYGYTETITTYKCECGATRQ